MTPGASRGLFRTCWKWETEKCFDRAMGECKILSSVDGMTLRRLSGSSKHKTLVPYAYLPGA